MTTMQIDRAVVEQALHVAESAGYPVALIKALRAALAQQADPTDPGNDVDVLREHVRHLERRVRQLHAQQAEPVAGRAFLERILAAMEGVLDVADRKTDEFDALRSCVIDLTVMLHTAPPQQVAQQDEPLNLSDRAVQRRLATQWGYVPAAQAEPVEPVAWNWMLDGLPYGRACYGDPPDADLAERAATAGRTVRLLYTAPPQRKPLTKEEIERIGMKHVTLREVIRAVERAHEIKE